jgi:YebC/PmpR family DNA-binding regulatory protein
MGRAHEVRAKKMAATSAAKSALYMRASKEIYIAAKSGVPDPNGNLALRSVLEKYKGQNIPRDVIDRAIKKAAGGDTENYESGRYEGFGPGNTFVIVDTLSNNVRRAFDEVRNCFNKRGGHLGTPGSVSFNFVEAGVIVFEGTNRDEVEENLVMSDVDVNEVTLEDGYIEVNVAPTAFQQAKDCLKEMGIEEFETCEITMIPNEYTKLTGEDADKMHGLLDMLDEAEDVQAVYHNAEFED